MFKLGLTGSIATGKSTALAAFAELGYPVFSADEAVHILYKGRAVAPVSAIFSQAVSCGIIDRTILSQLLIKNPKRMGELNAIVHPMVREEISKFVENARQQGADLSIVDIPLLYETGFEHGFEGIAVTFCDELTQRRRALARPDMSVEKLKAILAQQMSQSEKKQRADFLIDTNGSIEQTKEQVRAIAKICLTKKT
jgi:dephospho-CoA kinase